MRYKHIIFDFDGVLAESNEIKFEGFCLLVKDYPSDAVKRFSEYVAANGGKSRYEKIRYFFKEILSESIPDEKVMLYARRYSEIVKENVIKAEPVNGSLSFLSDYSGRYDFAVISASDEEELKDVCRSRGIDGYFAAILGSPNTKEGNLSRLLKEMKWEKSRCIFVGDSTSDLDAARINKIDFIGRNSKAVDWVSLGIRNIDDLSQLHEYLDKQR